jgi:hypothetical protein
MLVSTQPARRLTHHFQEAQRCAVSTVRENSDMPQASSPGAFDTRVAADE